MSGAQLIDEILFTLHRCEWSIGDNAFGEGPDCTWLVFGSNGENLVRVEDPDRAVGWCMAFLQAQATGMQCLTISENCPEPNGGRDDEPIA
jgi:hypothetical protein